MENNTCQNCIHWKRREDKTYGACAKTHHTPYFADPDDDWVRHYEPMPMGCISGENINTTEDFGCINFESIQNTNE